MVKDDDRKVLWCGNLSEKVSEDLLYELFLQAGPLEGITIPKDKEGKRRPYAFITFKHEESVSYTMALLDGIKLFGRQLRLQHRSGSDTKQNKYLLAMEAHQRSLYPADSTKSGDSGIGVLQKSFQSFSPASHHHVPGRHNKRYEKIYQDSRLNMSDFVDEQHVTDARSHISQKDIWIPSKLRGDINQGQRYNTMQSIGRNSSHVGDFQQISSTTFGQMSVNPHLQMLHHDQMQLFHFQNLQYNRSGIPIAASHGIRSAFWQGPV
ncbi:uncharacterized protein LOC143255298 [Tachypleus tridentatus]|uniref:uncharacterized protein LOC143255298 n=1 Tax=Tachypleus tridentatus TaxID=6853 RepID=UPI003FD35662